MDNFILQDWLILLITCVIAFGTLALLDWLLLARHKELTSEKKLPRQLSMLGFSIVAVIMVVLALPVIESSRNQLLGLLGVLVSGVIAFSSTTIVSNLMAGVVLSLNKPFRTGDFIRCKGFEGRVTEKGLLDTEIQTRQRALVHIANTFLINNPVEVIRSSGTLISAEASIGYDVHHAIIEQHLQKAADKAGLTDAFVHIVALGNFSVNYKVSGMLEDTKSMLTTESKLYAAILDELHAHDIEIMSPSIMAQRSTDPSYSFIARATVKASAETVNQEDLVFDKAEEAEKIESERNEIQDQIAALKVSLNNGKNGDDNQDAKLSIEQKAQVQSQLVILDAKLIALNSVDPSK
ncbi:MAG: small-conductance mechanosensitive channel [Alphaproteobacteria bacterium]|jgi:small-conductance mechanosensitive channel